MDKKDKRKKILKVSGLIGLFLLVFGLSYALFTVTLNGTKKVKVKTGKLELQLLDANNNPIYITGQNNESTFAINLDNQVPVSDETGLSTQGFTFKLKNSGSINASYVIYLDDVALESGETRIDDQYVKYSLTKNNSEGSPALLSTTLVNNERELDKGIIEDDETNTYTLKIWIDEAATNAAMDKVFSATLRVEGVQYVEQPSPYGEKIAERQLSETITATYYQPEETGYNNTKVKRMSNIKKMDNEERYEGGTLVISGSGDMQDAEDFSGEDLSAMHLFLADIDSLSDVPLNNKELYDFDYEYKYNPINVVIEEGITKVGSYVLDNVKTVENVEFPTTLKEIGEFAFSSTSITTLELPEGLEIIGESAFSNCESLTVARIPSTVTTLGGAFTSCQNLREAYLGKNIESIGYGIFMGIADNSIVYCETQAVANLMEGMSYYNPARTQLIVDPTKFE